jgi:hypothetical protein
VRYRDPLGRLMAVGVDRQPHGAECHYPLVAPSRGKRIPRADNVRHNTTVNATVRGNNRRAFVCLFFAAHVALPPALGCFHPLLTLRIFSAILGGCTLSNFVGPK